MSEFNLGFRYVIQEIKNFNLGTTIKCENGNIYKLQIAKNGQRKFSREKGTKLRFMTYDNIDKMFKILEDEIDIQKIKELDIINSLTSVSKNVSREENLRRIDQSFVNDYYKINDLTKQQNIILQWAKQIDEKIKEKSNE